MNDSGKKILFIIPYIPYPLDTGGNQAFFNIVDYLRNFMDVSVLLDTSSHGSSQKVEALQKEWQNVTFYLFNKKKNHKDCKLYSVRQKWLYNILNAIQGSFARKMKRRIVYNDMIREKSTIFSSVYKELDDDYVQFVYDVSRKGFDIIQVEFYELLSLVYVLPPEPETVFLHHELRFVRNENEEALLQQVTPTDRTLVQIAKEYELAALQHYKHIIVLTKTDKNLLMSYLNRGWQDIYDSPAIVSSTPQKQASFVPAETHLLTFVGSGDHFPNLDALTWFAEEIAPLLRAAHFNFQLQVTGKWHKAKRLKQLQERCPELHGTGFVADLADTMKGSINIIPIRIGSGMRMKILDSVLAKVPFITTSKGVEGLDFQNGEDCIIANDATSFAKAVMTLSDDAVLQKEMAEHAYSRLEQLYNPSQMLEKRRNIYRHILDSNS